VLGIRVEAWQTLALTASAQVQPGTEVAADHVPESGAVFPPFKTLRSSESC